MASGRRSSRVRAKTRSLGFAEKRRRNEARSRQLAAGIRERRHVRRRVFIRLTLVAALLSSVVGLRIWLALRESAAVASGDISQIRAGSSDSSEVYSAEGGESCEYPELDSLPLDDPESR